MSHSVLVWVVPWVVDYLERPDGNRGASSKETASIASHSAGETDPHEDPLFEELKSRPLLARPGIDDLGLTVGGFFRVVRDFKNPKGESYTIYIEEGGWFDPDDSYNIKIQGPSYNRDRTFRVVSNLVPIGPYLLIETVFFDGESSKEFGDKIVVLGLFLD